MLAPLLTVNASLLYLVCGRNPNSMGDSEVSHSAQVGRFHCRFPRWISAKNTVFRANQGRLRLPAADALVLNAGCPFDFARRISRHLIGLKR